MAEVDHGWYSAEQAKRAGTFIYSSPDGREVEVSSVTSADAHEMVFDDVVRVGPVTRFVRDGLGRAKGDRLPLTALRWL